MRTIFNISRNVSGNTKIRELHNVTILCDPAPDGRGTTFDHATIYFSDVFPDGMDLICAKGRDPFFIRHSLIRGIMSVNFQFSDPQQSIDTKLLMQQHPEAEHIIQLNYRGPEEDPDVLII